MLLKQNVKEKKKCLYGTVKCWVYLELGKLGRTTLIFQREQVPDIKTIRQCERLIHKLQDKLGVYPTVFRQLGALGYAFIS
jgi:hypothetical protein